jgi:hypothetical protein
VRAVVPTISAAIVSTTGIRMLPPAVVDRSANRTPR